MIETDKVIEENSKHASWLAVGKNTIYKFILENGTYKLQFSGRVPGKKSLRLVFFLTNSYIQ